MAWITRVNTVFASESDYESRRKDIIEGYDQTELPTFVVRNTVFCSRSLRSYRHSEIFYYGVPVILLFKWQICYTEITDLLQ
jgi:hypothetical protein